MAGKGPTYDGLMGLMGRVYEDAGDRIEAARWPDETRAEAKRRLMREVYEADMRAKYHMMPREFMQGYHGAGKPYDTHNPWHFQMRYGMKARPGIRVGVYKDTPQVMMVEAVKERAATVTLRILRHGA